MTQTTLDGYTKEELKKIVDMYNLDIDMKVLKKKKEEIVKEMKKVGKKNLTDLPTKEKLKKYKFKKTGKKGEDPKQPKIDKMLKKKK